MLAWHIWQRQLNSQQIFIFQHKTNNSIRYRIPPSLGTIICYAHKLHHPQNTITVQDQPQDTSTVQDFLQDNATIQDTSTVQDHLQDISTAQDHPKDTITAQDHPHDQLKKLLYQHHSHYVSPLPCVDNIAQVSCWPGSAANSQNNLSFGLGLSRG